MAHRTLELMQQHHSPIIYVANTGALLSYLLGHLGETAAALSIIINILVLSQMIATTVRGMWKKP